MPNATLKHTRLVIVDPGGDPAVGHVHSGHGSASSGGFVDAGGVVESTQVTGWRGRLISRGAAT